MKVKCLYKTGYDLKLYEYNILKQDELGRFGATQNSEYNDLDINKEYFVMGIIIFQTYQAFLLDDGNYVFSSPCQLFEIIDDSVNKEWYSRFIKKNEDIYPFIQYLIGYKEFCLDLNSYEKLIIDKEEEYLNIYFTRKKELFN